MTATSTATEPESEKNTRSNPGGVSSTQRAPGRWLRRLGGTPEAVLANPELMALQLPALRADLLVSMAHDRLPAPVGAPLLLLRGSEDHTVDAAGMDAWRPVSTGAVQRREYPGGHHPLAENRHRLLEDLEACADPGRSR